MSFHFIVTGPNSVGMFSKRVDSFALIHASGVRRIRCSDPGSISSSMAARRAR